MKNKEKEKVKKEKTHKKDRPLKNPQEKTLHQEKLIDDSLKESFPASDPPSIFMNLSDKVC